MNLSDQHRLNDEYLARLKAVECSDSTFPASNPALVFAEAFGSKIWDVSGREYDDFCAGFGVLALGHNHPSVTARLAARYQTQGRAPITHGMGDVYPSRAKVELLETLVQLLPAPLSTAALALSGGQAVEIALKSAFLRTKKMGIICFDGSYHGLDLGVLPLTARADFREPFSGWYGEQSVRRLPFKCDEATLRVAIRDLNAKMGAAAIVVEPIQGRAGVIAAGRDWLQLLRRLCDEQHLLLIYDEVFTGLGRSGRMTFAADVACDLLCLGKALGGGLPLSACVGTHDAMSGWPQSCGEAIHTGTFFGHPLACETGLATLQIIIAEDLCRRANEQGKVAIAILEKTLKSAVQLKEIRGEGLMIALEFHHAGLGAELMNGLRKHGIIALASGAAGECLTLTPALTIPEAAWHKLALKLAVLLS